MMNCSLENIFAQLNMTLSEMKKKNITELITNKKKQKKTKKTNIKRIG